MCTMETKIKLLKSQMNPSNNIVSLRTNRKGDIEQV